MRPLPATFALLLSATAALASPADARADTACHNYSPPYFGNTQVQLGNNGCVPLTGVKVTVAVTQDIKVASSTGYKGFSMQLNANGASSGLTSSQQFWQQFVIMVGAGSSLNGVEGFTQQWSTVQKAGDIYPTNPMFMGAPSTVKNALLTIPAGTTFTWTLATDSHSNVESVTYSAHDNLGTRYTSATEYIPAADRTPIFSVTMDIVGYTNLSYTSFQTGAGTITYEATSLSASYDYPSCASNTGTGESSDMGYGPLSGKAGGVFDARLLRDDGGELRKRRLRQSRIPAALGLGTDRLQSGMPCGSADVRRLSRSRKNVDRIGRVRNAGAPRIQ